MIAQKTWVELLGTDTWNCEVAGRFIVRKTDSYDRNGREVYDVLWACENEDNAKEVFSRWFAECHAIISRLGESDD